MNLRNHGSVVLKFKVNNPDTTIFPRVDEKDMEDEIMKYHESKRRGFLTETNKAQAFIVSKRAKADGEHNWPDINIVIQQVAIEKGSPQTITVTSKVGRMKSSGEIGLNTTAYLNGERDDLKLALLDYRLFSDASDTQVVIEG